MCVFEIEIITGGVSSGAGTGGADDCFYSLGVLWY
jgi:hypothetical protein